MIRAILGLVLAATLAAGARAECRLALLLALDVSGSVDAAEYRLQMSGLASALGDPAVTGAFLAIPDAPVSLAIYEWSSTEYQALIVDWTRIASPADLSDIADTLRVRQRADVPESTGLGGALIHADRLFARGPDCWKQTLDISADGQNNDWPVPEQVLADGALAGVGINVLAIRGPLPGAGTPEIGLTELVEYYRRKIIQGPGAFVEPARGYHDYARAMQRKLMRELSVLTIGRVQ